MSITHLGKLNQAGLGNLPGRFWGMFSAGAMGLQHRLNLGKRLTSVTLSENCPFSSELKVVLTARLLAISRLSRGADKTGA